MEIIQYYEEMIIKLKKRLIESYMLLLVSFFVISLYIHKFWLKNDFSLYYFSVAIVFYIYSYLLIRKNYNLIRVVIAYLIFSSLHISVVILNFIDDSAVGFIWLIPIPIFSYVFLEKKQVIFFIIYTITLMALIVLYSRNFEHHFYAYDKKFLLPTNIASMTANLVIICLLIYFKMKINHIETRLLTYKIKNKIKNRIILPTASRENKESNNNKNMRSSIIIDNNKLDSLFMDLENYIKNEKNFTNPNLKISNLCTELNTNINYLSKVINYKGYKNFNHYLNSIRIEHFKNRLDNEDLGRVTLMYIYTEAGFTSQATFNRVFKQIEGITPSEYLKRKNN